MPFKLVIPAARSSATIGARSAAARLARADRAMSAVFGARWPKWDRLALRHCATAPLMVRKPFPRVMPV
jgi:hypothetical protein